MENMFAKSEKGSTFCILVTIADLDFLIGAWNILSYDYIDGQWQAGEPNTAVIEPILDGMSLKEFMQVKGPKYDVQMTTIFTYDPFAKEFHVASIDKKFSYIDVFDGQFDEVKTSLEVNNFKRGVPLLVNDRPMSFRLSWTSLAEEGVEFLVESTVDEGKIWKPESRIVYTK